jgi:hypothetical protein
MLLASGTNRAIRAIAQPGQEPYRLCEVTPNRVQAPDPFNVDRATESPAR